ncbi:MAG: hypothetical protein HY756_00720 [Nitrospirae bacterium]|nr:hypothetical protein [Nitrospirota bacterium]
MKKYILKEHGAWGVMSISYLTGILASLKTSPHIEDALLRGVIALIATALFINLKHSMMKWLREYSREHLISFISQVSAASLLLIAVFGKDAIKLLPYAGIPLIYLLLLRLIGEHSLLTEVCGFSLLALSALIAGFAVTGSIDNKLFLSVAVFFVAGVLKVRVQTRKGTEERIYMLLYLVFAASVYYLINSPLLSLIPLIDNLALSVRRYNVKLRVAGWIEVAKGVLFMALFSSLS